MSCIREGLRFGFVGLLWCLNGSFNANALAADEKPTESVSIPFVYSAESSGAEFEKPRLPSLEQLPSVPWLPDPFAWSSGDGRSTNFSDWAKRRLEIQAEIERYGIGEKPPRPEQLTASFDGGVLRVVMSEGDASLTLEAKVVLPEGEGPFPAVIGIGFGGGAGSLPADIFTDRKIASIAFDFRQVMAHQQKRGSEPINKLFPDRTDIGAYSAWSWGISRLIDGLELTQVRLPIDLKHLGVTGCSFAGKMALFAGALDERIALTIAQESGGGGAAAWRVSETLGNVETLAKTSHAWFSEEMFQFADQVDRLPYDHHELMALVAPRALLVLGNPDFEWLADESGYVSSRAAHEVWKQFGVAERFGFSILGGHPHCRLPDAQRPEVEAFVDKFLLGLSSVDTDVTEHPFALVEHEFWYDAWLKGKSTFPSMQDANMETFIAEAEAMSPGEDWEILNAEDASGGKYISVKEALDSPGSVPAGDAAAVSFDFESTKATKYFVYARVNCPNADDDSFWFQVDDQGWAYANGLQTKGWHWVKIAALQPSPGKHRFQIKYRENGAMLDSIGITTYPFGPEGLEATQRQPRGFKDDLRD